MNRRTLLRVALLGAAGLAQAAAQAPIGVVGTPHCSDAQPWPPRFTLEFAVTASRGTLRLEGDNTLSYVREGNRYDLHSVTRSLLYRARQDSRGIVQGKLLRPLEYVEQNQRRASKSVRFDWTDQTVSFSANPEQPGRTSPLLQDRLSLLLQLGERLRARPEGDVEFLVAGVQRVSPYRFERRGREVLEVPAGVFETIRAERRSEERNDRIEAWYAPSQCWLPVQVRFIDEHGLVLENQLRRAIFD